MIIKYDNETDAIYMILSDDNTGTSNLDLVISLTR